MIKKYKVNILSLWILIVGVAVSQEWIWPTSASKWLTSSFCELRPRRYHAGWDVKTWGQTGYPVFAMKDGYVWRVRVSPSGYGRVVYVKHPDGYYSVYAHLSRFMDSLEALVRHKQVQSHQYIQEFYFKPHDFPVRQGDVIAYSGDTGIGFPHLHFEIRDAQHHPLFPGKYFKSILTDNFYPLFMGITFKEESFFSSVDGQWGNHVFNQIERKSTSEFLLSHVPVVFGPFSVEFFAIDRMKKGFNRLTYNRAQLFIDSTLVTEVRYDTLNYAYNHHIELERDFQLAVSGLSRYRSFKKSPHFKQDFYKKVEHNGVIGELKNGRHSFRIKIFDMVENSSTLSGHFYWYPTVPQVSIENSTGDSVCVKFSPFYPGSRVNIQYLQYHSPARLTAEYTFDDKNTRSDSIICSIPVDTALQLQAIRIHNGFPGGTQTTTFINLIKDNSTPAHVYVEKIEDFPNYYIVYFKGEPYVPSPILMDLNYRADYFKLKWLNPQSLKIKIHKKVLIGRDSLRLSFGNDVLALPLSQSLVKRGIKKDISYRDSIFTVSFYEGSIYDSMFVNIRKFPSAILPGEKKYPLVVPVYKVETQSVPMNDLATVHFKIDSLQNKNHCFPVYFDQKSGKWLFLPFQINQDSTVFSANVFSMEFFSMSIDTIPPVIQSVKPRRKKESERDLFYKIFDEFSGIKSMNQIRVYVDSEPVLFIYDPEKKMITIPHYVLSSGHHIIVVKAKDNAGNESNVWNEITIN